MRCAEHIRLQQEQQTAVQTFRSSIHHLVALIDNSATDSDFNLAHRKIMADRRTCEASRDALKHHQEEHGC
jgi:hypothetical protein